MGLSCKQVSTDHIEFNWTQNIEIKQVLSNQRMKRSLQTQQTADTNLKCPRCDSTNTKFCYYNNYNKTQPRHFCKACKRHWTKGGTLRNVPVGGGRKNKRIKRAIATTTADHSLGLSDQKKYMFSSDDKGLFFKPLIDGEFDHQVSWDYNDVFISSMQQSHDQNLGLGFSMHSNLSSFIDTNPIPTPILFDDSTVTTTTSRTLILNSSTVSQVAWMQLPTTSKLLEPNYWTWNDSMVQLADLNKPGL